MRQPNGERTWNAGEGLGYLRVSKDEQDQSVEGQLNEVVQPALQRCGLTLRVPPFEDDGKRGHDETRPGLHALLEYCRSHPVRPRTTRDYVPIFTQSTDRFGRFLDPMKIITYFNELKELGYDVYSVTEDMNYVGGNISDWIRLIVKSDQATGYSVRLSHDSLRGGIQTAKKGYLAGGSAAYGYDRSVVGPDGKPRHRYVNLPGKRVAKYTMDGTLVATLEPLNKKGKLIAPSLDKSNADHVIRIIGDALKVKAVERIFELYINEGLGFRTIADILNHEGYPPPRSRKWLSSAVRSIITNPVYMGTGVYGRRSKSKFHEFSVENSDDNAQINIKKKEIFGHEFVYRPMNKCIVDHDAHPAIIPKERWYRAQEILAAKTKDSTPKRTGRGARSPYLLTGLVKCSRCGYSYQGRTDPRTGHKSYQCGGYVSGGKSVCRRASLSADGPEDWITEEARKRLLDGRADLFDSYKDFEKAIASEIASQFRSSGSKSEHRKMIQNQLSEKRKKIDLILNGLSEDNLDVANDMIRSLKGEISALEEQLRRQKEKDHDRDALDPKKVAREAAIYLWNLKQVLEKGTIEERRKFIQYFVESVKINGLEGWVEVSFFETPNPPGVTFCMVPPRGVEPLSPA